MARLLFTTFGSYGDLYPYIAVATELQKRGHQVTLGTSESYRDKAAAEGIGFAAIRPDVSLDDREMLAYVFDQKRGTERIIKMLLSVLRESYEDTLRAGEGMDLILTHPITYGAVLAAQKRRLRWVSSVLAPISFLSAYDPPVLPNAIWLSSLHRFGPGLMNVLWRLGRSRARMWTNSISDLRREMGLPPGENPLFEGAHAPELVLAFFSSLIAKPQPDWPPQTVVTGFPFYDGLRHTAEIPSALLRFLESGAPPVVFTLGSSAVGAAGDFYSESLKTIELLGARAVFLTGAHSQGLPQNLPPNVHVVPYAPHSLVFPRASVIVHQGGIGTTAQALRSGRPMLVVPFAHDQFDNGARVRALGAGEVLYRSRYNALTAAAALRRLIEDPAVQRGAAAAGNVIRVENGAVTAADALERLL